MPTGRVLFVCQHGSAKSVIAAMHFRRLAAERGLTLAADTAAAEPDEAVPPHVVAGLVADGVGGAMPRPRAVTPRDVRGAAHVVSFGCDLTALAAGRAVERWDDVPMVSDGYDVARAAIVERVAGLLDRLAPRRGR